MDWIEEGIELTINNRFEEAEVYLQLQIKNNPADYRTYFYYAAVLNSKMTHFETTDDEESFDWALEKTIKIIDSILALNNTIDDSTYAQHLFYLGSAFGYRAFFQGQNKNWLAALSNGVKSNRTLQKAVEFDSTCYDAYLGIGVFKYWRHSILKYFAWLPFVPDERDEGINLIKKSIQHSRYSKYLARQQLVYILVHYSKPEEAISYAQEITERYPDSQFMLWAAAHAYHKDGDLHNAAIAYQHLLEIITDDPDYNPQHLIKCKMKLAEIYCDSEQYENCLLECKQLLLFLDNEQEEEIARVMALMDRCREYNGDEGGT